MNAFEFAEDLSGAQTGTAYYVPRSAVGVSVTLEVLSGTAKVQSTTDLLDAVMAGSAVWVDWPSGAVAVATQDFCRAVTALRGVSISGSARVMLRAAGMTI